MFRGRGQRRGSSVHGFIPLASYGTGMDDTETSRRRFLAACTGALAAGTAGCSLAPGSGPSGVGERVEPTTPEGDSGSAAGDFQQFDQSADGTYEAVYRDAIGSVAQIQVFTDTAAGRGQGTGFVYGEEYVVTNQHVVDGAEEIALRFPEGGWLDGEVVGSDVYSDLAVLSVEGIPDGATPLALAESDPAVGAEVIAIGNPFGYSGSVSAGIVSGVDRTLQGPNRFSIPDTIQTDAPVNPGNSGGPLVTLDGTVVGVVNAGGGDNIGFAISAPLTRRVIPALLEDGEFRHSYMGVGITSVGPLLAEANDVANGSGVYVSSVRSGSPSDGVFEGTTDETTLHGQPVETGGDVIVAMEETPIPTRQALASFLALETSPGDTIDVEVLRDRQRQTVELTLGERPDPET